MSDVLSTLRQWSGTASSNKPADTDVIGSGLGDNLRTIQAVLKNYLAGQSSTVVPSAGVADLSTATGHWVPVSGNSTVTGFGTEVAGIEYIVTFTGSPPLINSTTLALPGAATVQASAGDVCVAESLGGGSWKIWGYTRSSGFPAATPSPITNSISGDISLNNTGTFFDGPSIAQGTSGTWFVSGSVTVNDTGGAARFYAKLWDGTTIIDSGSFTSTGAGGYGVIALSGYIVSPASNLKISVRDISLTTGQIVANVSGQGKDSTITAIRIA